MDGRVGSEQYGDICSFPTTFTLANSMLHQILLILVKARNANEEALGYYRGVRSVRGRKGLEADSVILNTVGKNTN